MSNIKDKLVKAQRPPIISDRVRSCVLNAEGETAKSKKANLPGTQDNPRPHTELLL